MSLRAASSWSVNARLWPTRWSVAETRASSLAEAAACLVLLRGTVQFDSRQHEAAWTSARAA